jgi:hypothetical protein
MLGDSGAALMIQERLRQGLCVKDRGPSKLLGQITYCDAPKREEAVTE